MISALRFIKHFDVLVRKIYDIICKDWNPLGFDVVEDEPLGETEYSEYLPEIIKILVSDKSILEVEQVLIEIVAAMYRNKPENIVKFPGVIRKFDEIRPEFKKYYRLSKKALLLYSAREIKRLEQMNDKLNEYL